MATGTSIVGEWLLTTDWSYDGSNPPSSFGITFNADGSLVAGISTSGYWLQVGGMACWSFKGSPDLIYTANVNADALVGIMGYTSWDSNRTGCFFAARPPSGATSSAVSGATQAQGEDTTSIFGPAQPG
ncbi:MAG TPA: hypothetical protein VJ842_03530 [Pyrinomonadaceae bacterium]|nr:hypothetical protein [Pyrinomonadaceae bacterium]